MQIQCRMPRFVFSASAGRPEAGSLRASCPEARRWHCPASRKENRRFPAAQPQHRRRTTFGRKQDHLPEHALRLFDLAWHVQRQLHTNTTGDNASHNAHRRASTAVVFPLWGVFRECMQQVALASASQGNGLTSLASGKSRSPGIATTAGSEAGSSALAMQDVAGKGRNRPSGDHSVCRNVDGQQHEQYRDRLHHDPRAH